MTTLDLLFKLVYEPLVTPLAVQNFQFNLRVYIYCFPLLFYFKVAACYVT